MTFVYILIAGLFGVVGHWMTRWSQRRTSSTFMEYLVEHKAHTVSSVFTIVGSVGLIYQGMGDSALFSALLTAYTSGYTLDSMLNKDAKFTREPESVSIKSKVDDEKAKSLRAIIDDDAQL
jgi:hypothetical protein